MYNPRRSNVTTAIHEHFQEKTAKPTTNYNYNGSKTKSDKKTSFYHGIVLWSTIRTS